MNNDLLVKIRQAVRYVERAQKVVKVVKKRRNRAQKGRSVKRTLNAFLPQGSRNNALGFWRNTPLG